MLIELAILGGSVLVSGGGAFFAGRKVSDDETLPPSKDFVCPYCTNIVTGFKELDLIHHVSCIGKSESDLAAQASKPKIVEGKDEYFTTYTKHTTNWDGQYNSKYAWTRHSTEIHSRVAFVVFRNGKEIADGSHPTKDGADSNATEQIDLDKHKRRTAGRA